ncbi:hypothetical protein BX070DRAFT_232765 [Coemansia spiralis]|nr:hypothetical protein BX070DRAFT_232765 [Coemansia spiralis]
MRGATLYRYFAVALFALFCLAGQALSQNDNNEGSQSSSPSVTAETTPTNSGTTSASPDSASSTSGTVQSKTSNKHTNSGSSESPTATADESQNSDGSETFDASYDETGMPGTVSLMTPNYQAVPTPMFVIGEQIVLGWEYSNDTRRPPNKLSICGRFPTGTQVTSDSRSVCQWNIAVNISGTLRKYTWDTLTEGAPGVAFSEGSGYQMYFYDSEYGVNNAVPGAGRIVPSVFWFNMYRSRYGLTNEGVPVGYDPSTAAAVAIHGLVTICMVLISIVCAFA